MTITQMEQMAEEAPTQKEREAWLTVIAVKTGDPKRVKRAVALAINKVEA